jgi:hypothetical protein
VDCSVCKGLFLLQKNYSSRDTIPLRPRRTRCRLRSGPWCSLTSRASSQTWRRRSTAQVILTLRSQLKTGRHFCRQCCEAGSGIRCLFDPWILDPGWVKNPDHISESLETIFWVKILKFFDADPGSGCLQNWSSPFLGWNFILIKNYFEN